MTRALVRVYVAAPKVELLRARLIADRLRGLHGVDVCSTWHTTMQPGAKDPTSRAAAADILRANLRDLGAAHVMVALPREGVGAETYVEIGRALARRMRVIVSAGKGGVPLSWADERATLAETDSRACEMVRAWAADGGAPR